MNCRSDANHSHKAARFLPLLALPLQVDGDESLPPANLTLPRAMPPGKLPEVLNLLALTAAVSGRLPAPGFAKSLYKQVLETRKRR
jgi:hypothetical protein